MGPTRHAWIACALLWTGCGVGGAFSELLRPPCRGDVDYDPGADAPWPVVSAEEAGLDREAVDELFCDAERSDTLRGALLAVDGQLVGEAYFGQGSIDERDDRRGITDVFTTAIAVGIPRRACDLNKYIELVELFPEVEGAEDPLVQRITTWDLLDGRSGLPHDALDDDIEAAIRAGDAVSVVLEIALEDTPGVTFHDSHLGSNLLLRMLEAYCEESVQGLADAGLFEPLGIESPPWETDADGVPLGHTGLELTARELLRFGQLFHEGGELDGDEVLDGSLVREALADYTDRGASRPGTSSLLRDYGHGYGWWSARAGEVYVDFAWGDGGSFLVLEPSTDTVIVLTADPLDGSAAEASEEEHLDLIARFVETLPTDG